MALFVVVALCIFLMFGKNVVIVWNGITEVVDPAARKKSVTYFSLFIILCTIVWLVLKYAYKPIAFVAVWLVTLYFSNRYNKWLKKKAEVALAELKKEKGTLDAEHN